MPAKHYIDNEAKLIITTWLGDAVDIDFIEAINKYHNEIQNNPEYIEYNEVVDFTNISGIRLTTKGMRNIGKIASKTDLHGVNRKLAFIVGSKLAFGLARMYVTYRSFEKKSNKEIRIFKIENEAFEWVKNRT